MNRGFAYGEFWMPSTSKSLVMGCVSHLPAEQFLPFVKSLRATSYKGRLVLFGANLSPATIRTLQDYADELHLVDSDYPRALGERKIQILSRLRKTRHLGRVYSLLFRGFCGTGDSSAASVRRRYAEFRLEGLQALRYQHYLSYLVKVGAGCDYVLVSDVRDVLFQTDPFSKPPERLTMVLEPPEMDFSLRGFNGRWVWRLYGREGVAALARKTPSCSGTTVGPRDEMKNYLEIMAREVAAQKWPLGSHDQGIHNYLLYRGAFGDTTIQINGTGSILTVGGMKNLSIGPDGRVYNPDGSLPAIIHQYDRHTAHAARLRHLLCGEGIA